MNTVPNKVDHLVRAQFHHDRRQHNERSMALINGKGSELKPRVDYLTPVIADGDTGHGGLSAVMKLTKLFIEAGAAGKSRILKIMRFNVYNSRPNTTN
jgi:isocitrate lyase